MFSSGSTNKQTNKQTNIETNKQSNKQRTMSDKTYRLLLQRLDRVLYCHNICP